MLQGPGIVNGYAPAIGLSKRFVLTYGLERLASWILAVAIVVLVYRLTDSIAMVAAVILVQILARLTVSLLTSPDGERRSPPARLAAIARVAAVTALILVDSHLDIWWALIAAAAVSAANAINDVDRARQIPRIVHRRQIPRLNRRLGRIEQASALVGPAIAAAVLFVGSEAAALALAAALFYISLIAMRGQGPKPGDRVATVVAGQRGTPEAGWADLPSRVHVVATGLVVAAALAVLVRVTLVGVIMGGAGDSASTYAILLGLFGAGALAGPPPVDRILARIPSDLVIAGCVAWLVASTLVIGLGGPILVLVPIMVCMGLVAVTLDIVAASVARRRIAEDHYPAVNQLLLRLVAIGQAATLIGAMLVSAAWNPAAATLLVCAICLLVTGVHFLRAGGIRALHQFYASARQQASGRKGTSG